MEVILEFKERRVDNLVNMLRLVIAALCIVIGTALVLLTGVAVAPWVLCLAGIARLSAQRIGESK
jgi:hypothetical protein